MKNRETSGMKWLYKPFMTLHLMVHGYEVVYRQSIQLSFTSVNYKNGCCFQNRVDNSYTSPDL